MPIQPAQQKSSQQLNYPLDGVSQEIVNNIVNKNSFGTNNVSYKVVGVTVTAAATSGVSSADDDLINGEIFGYYPTGNQDQFVDNVVLSSSGVVTITLAAAATVDNTFNVIVLKQ